MITFIVQLRVRPANVSAFEALMAQVVAMTRAHEPGVLHYDFSRSVDQPDSYVVIEVYRDAEAHAAHMASDWVRDSLPASAGLVEGPPHIRQYVSGGSEPVRQRLYTESPINQQEAT
jgi:quinol monooxygenase YgiN